MFTVLNPPSRAWLHQDLQAFPRVAQNDQVNFHGQNKKSCVLYQQTILITGNTSQSSVQIYCSKESIIMIFHYRSSVPIWPWHRYRNRYSPEERGGPRQRRWRLFWVLWIICFILLFHKVTEICYCCWEQLS